MCCEFNRDNRLGLECICAVIRQTSCVIWAKTGGVICFLFEASATACLSHPGSKRWRNLGAASLNLSSLFTSYFLCSRYLANLDGSISCFFSLSLACCTPYCKSQLSPHSISDWVHYLSHSPTTDSTRTLLSHTHTQRFEAHCSSNRGDAGKGKEIKLPLIYSLSVSFSFPRSGPFPSSCPVLIIDGLSSAAELETEAIDWPRNRHGFLLKVVKNLPWLMAKQFLEASWRGGGIKQWVACTNNWY